MSNISDAINTSYGAIEVAPNSILNKYNFPIEKLGAKTPNTFEPYHYKENVEDFYSALCAAYPPLVRPE